MQRSDKSLSPQGQPRQPPSGFTSNVLFAMKNEPCLPSQAAHLAHMEDILDPYLAARAVDQFLDSPEPHDDCDLFAISSGKFVDPATLSLSSPQSVCEPSLTPVGDGDELFLRELWINHRSEAGANRSDACDFGSSSSFAMDDTAIDPIVDQDETTPKDEEDQTHISETHRRRQRQYEKKYRNRKKCELKRLRKEWLEAEVQFLKARRDPKAGAVVATKHQTLSEVEARTPPRDHRDLVRRCRLLAALERSLLLDRMAFSALRAFEKIACIREYTDKDVLRTHREWQQSSNKVFGPHAKLAPHGRPLLHFTW